MHFQSAGGIVHNDMATMSVLPSYKVLVFSHSDQLTHEIYCSTDKEADRLFDYYSDQVCKACAIWSSEANRIVKRIGRLPDVKEWSC